MSKQWLLERVPGFDGLSVEDRAAILDFTFLWSLFESRVRESFATARGIRRKVDEWRDAGEINADEYGLELTYFRQRYFTQGEFTHHFRHLNLRPGETPDIVQSVLDGRNDDPRDRMLTVLMIVWRFRNNLFHGKKWAYQVQGQRSNFKHANTILMRLIDRYGRLVA